MSHLKKFHPAISNWFHQEFNQVSPPQEKGWPAIADGKHTLILAPTGSGKTLAAFLWCINDLFCRGLDSEQKIFSQNPWGVHTLYISPLKALNNDIQRNLKHPLSRIAKTSRKMDLQSPEIRVQVRTGDTPTHIRQSMVQRPPHILITTPESFYLLLTSERGRDILHNIRFLIVDEIHAITSNKRGVHLSLSMERLSALTTSEPIRIGLSATQKPLERIASFLGGQLYNAQDDSFKARPVTIIDCGQNKAMDVKVISPVKSFSDLPESSVWPAVIKQLYDLISSHRTTLVFINMRSHAEKVAKQLNDMYRRKTGDEKKRLAFPHHGSMSREMRFQVEENLKKGQIPAVIATASLELGIDIGTIDLVVQLEAPKNVSGAMQRVGRSGHLLQATSKGRIIPMYPSDLDDALALTRSMKIGDIEETIIPENCLDVLAQQIVAEVAMKNWNFEDLYNLAKQSYCYRKMSQMVFENTIEMLSGRFSDTKLPALQGRINWDKVNHKLIARRGARLTAILNGGTIPDRGYYSVVLAENNVRLGEMEEEFVFESKIGDVFFLGNTEWRIETITHDRIIVSPQNALEPRVPFWKGEIPSKNYSTSEKIGIFREKFRNNIDDEKLIDTLIKQYFSDFDSAQNLIDYFKRQSSLTGCIPTHNQLVIEYFHDHTGELNLVLHSPLGGRVTAPWVMSLSSIIAQEIGCEVQYSYNDDGFLIRILKLTEDLPIEDLFKIPSHVLERQLIRSLANSPLFAIQFRYNAARALLLPRSQPGKRIPLWLQRLRAADLLQVIKKNNDFPILVETYRTCLDDYFDLATFLDIADKVLKNEIRLHIVMTPKPSPMASGLLFNFLSNQMYDYDRLRTQSHLELVSSDLLTQVLSKGTIPSIVSREIVNQLYQHWQYLTNNTKAVDVEDLMAIIENLGPIEKKELAARSKGDVSLWIKQLSADNRIMKLKEEGETWIATAHVDLYSQPLTHDKVENILQRFLQVNGPLTLQELKHRLTAPESLIINALSQLVQEKQTIRGNLLVDSSEEFWCDRNNFVQLYRTAIARRRKAIVAVDRISHYKFLLEWHDFASSQMLLTSVLERYRGLKYSPLFFERELLRSRLFKSNTKSITHALEELNNAISGGEIVVYNKKAEEKRQLLSFIFRAQGSLLDDFQSNITNIKDLSEVEHKVYTFLKENGASFFIDIEDGTGLSNLQISRSLLKLANMSLVSCDDYKTFLTLTSSSKSRVTHKKQSKIPIMTPPQFSRIVRNQNIRQKVNQELQIKSGRWFLTSSFAVTGKTIDYGEKVEKQARILLQRHGILVKEWYRREQGFLPWFEIFQVLKRLEWQGEIRRGYFIKGLSGIQFALPQAVELLERIETITPNSFNTSMINTADPALPFGGQVDWDLYDCSSKKIPIVRGGGNHIIFIEGQPVCYCENYARRIFILKSYKKRMINDIIIQIKSWLMLPNYLRPYKRIEIESINGQEAMSNEIATEFMSAGFEREGSKLVVWPSGI